MDYGVFMNSLPHARNAAGRTGTQLGFYYLQDFTEGLVPPCKAYIFLNAWHLDDAQVSTIHRLLGEQDATAIWQFAPGLCTDKGWDPARTTLVTGIPVEIAPGPLGSTGTKALASMPVATRIGNVLEPRLAIVPADGAIVLDEMTLRTLREDFPGRETAMNELSHQALFLNRDAHSRCGARLGFHLLQDLLEGLVPDAAAHVFPCCWNMRPQDRARLAHWWRARERGNAIWLFFAGLPPGFDGAEVALHELANIDARAVEGPAGPMRGKRALAGLDWGVALSAGPSWALADDAGTETLAVDAATGDVACARRELAPGKSSTLIANPSISWQALGALLDVLGVPRFSRDGEAMSCDGHVLSIHTRDGATTWRALDPAEASTS